MGEKTSPTERLERASRGRGGPSSETGRYRRADVMLSMLSKLDPYNPLSWLMVAALGMGMVGTGGVVWPGDEEVEELQAEVAELRGEVAHLDSALWALCLRLSEDPVADCQR